jgi:hypothetical protein
MQGAGACAEQSRVLGQLRLARFCARLHGQSISDLARQGSTLGCLACVDLQNAGALGVSAHGEDGIRRRCRGQALARSNLAFWDKYGLQGSVGWPQAEAQIATHFQDTLSYARGAPL